MSLRTASEQLANLRHGTQALAERLGDQERQLDAFVASSHRAARHGQLAQARAARVGVDRVRRLLATQAQRSVASAALAERLCANAHEQHAAAQRLLAQLGDGPGHADAHQHVVLVVDDHGDVRDLLAHVLQEAGFSVSTAGNGLEALIAAYDVRPGVIVMDVSMPVLDGIEATRLIKAGEATRDARVIAHTGKSPFEAGLTAPMFAAVMQKPVGPDVVIATVQRVAGL